MEREPKANPGLLLIPDSQSAAPSEVNAIAAFKACDAAEAPLRGASPLAGRRGLGARSRP